MNLFKISLACSLIGLISLFFISGSIDVEDVAISQINHNDLDSLTEINGEVISIHETDQAVILKLSKPETITVMLYKNQAVKLKKGDRVEVRGKLEEYNGEMELIGDEVRLAP